MTQKLFCFVDESGQETRGELFIVSVVVTDAEVNQLRNVCEAIERESLKGARKWTKTNFARKYAYVKKVILNPVFKNKLSFAVYHSSLDYTSLTAMTITEALKAKGDKDYRVTIFIDGLPRALEQAVGLKLRRSGIPAKKVRGVKREESDALIRLADAVCGFVRDAMDGESKMRALFEQAIQSRILIDVSEK